MLTGLVEYVSRNCALGWLAIDQRNQRQVYAVLEDRVIGSETADIRRADLDALEFPARAFVIPYDQPVASGAVGTVQIHVAGQEAPLLLADHAVIDSAPATQIFLLGAPCSGASRLAATLTSSLGLSWAGDCPIGPRFAAASQALRGDPASSSPPGLFLATHDDTGPVTAIARKTYYFIHSSVSFLDKTLGVPMIKAAPFLSECFPEAKFIYVRRNGIANVRSRLSWFGGEFDAQCADWAAVLESWDEIRDRLPPFLEITREDMHAHPDAVAERLAAYLDCPPLSRRIAESLRFDHMETTGAGASGSLLAEAGWSAEQQDRFREICGPAMIRNGYAMDEPAGDEREG